MTNTDALDYVSWKQWSANEFGRFGRQDGIYYDKEFALCGLTSLRGYRVLEIGFGNGAFAGWVSEQGAEYFGTEAIAELVALARERGFNAFAADTPLSAVAEQGTIDVVVAFDVFEHLTMDRLESLMREIHALLRSGGVLVGRVPSGDSPFARAIQNGDLTHRLTLGSSAIDQLASRSGFTVSTVREPALPLLGLGFFTCLRRTAVVCVRRIFYPLISNIFMGGGAPVLTPTMTFVLSR